MEPATKKKFESWLKKQLFIERRSEGRCKSFVLRNANPGKLRAETHDVETVDIGDTSPPVDKLNELVEDIANTILEAGDNDAEGLGGVQRYVVHAYYEHSDKPVSRYTFRIMGEEEEGETDDFDNEPATSKGQTAQAMRHAEAFAKIMTGAFGQAQQILLRTNARQSEQIEKFMETHMTIIELVSNLNDHKAARDLETRKQDYAEKMKEKLGEKLFPLLPVIANRIAGRPVLPGTHPQQMMLKAFSESLTKEQMNGLMQVLNPEQVITVVEMMGLSQTPAYGKPEETKSNGEVKDGKASS